PAPGPWPGAAAGSAGTVRSASAVAAMASSSAFSTTNCDGCSESRMPSSRARRPTASSASALRSICPWNRGISGCVPYGTKSDESRYMRIPTSSRYSRIRCSRSMDTATSGLDCQRRVSWLGRSGRPSTFTAKPRRRRCGGPGSCRSSRRAVCIALMPHSTSAPDRDPACTGPPRRPSQRPPWTRRRMFSLLTRPAAALLLASAAGILAAPAAAQDASGHAVAQQTRSGEELYRAACAACHGVDGTGTTQALVGFDVPLPDFTDCSFASREPDADWIAVAHQGGPIRGFSRLMPAFGAALTVDELQSVMDSIRTVCRDDGWPRGELNLPRAQVTEKAYPEDELVLTTVFAIEGPGAWMNEFVYEKRFG